MAIKAIYTKNGAHLPPVFIIEYEVGDQLHRSSIFSRRYPTTVMSIEAGRDIFSSAGIALLIGTSQDVDVWWVFHVERVVLWSNKLRALWVGIKF